MDSRHYCASHSTDICSFALFALPQLMQGGFAEVGACGTAVSPILQSYIPAYHRLNPIDRRTYRCWYKCMQAISLLFNTIIWLAQFTSIPPVLSFFAFLSYLYLYPVGRLSWRRLDASLTKTRSPPSGRTLKKSAPHLRHCTIAYGQFKMGTVRISLVGWWLYERVQYCCLTWICYKTNKYCDLSRCLVIFNRERITGSIFCF